MSEASGRSPQVDPEKLSQSMLEVAGKSQKLVQDFLSRQESAELISHDDSRHMLQLFQDFYARLMSDPVSLVQAQMQFWQNYMALMHSTSMRMMGMDSEPAIAPKPGDKRFKDAQWEENPLFDFIKQSYLLTADHVHNTVANVEGMDDKTKRKVDFYTRQFVNAMSPTNFVATNPEVLQKTIDTGGQNLINGLNKLLEDLERGNGELKIRMTHPEAFEVGKDMAVTPGKVVYQNDLIQLIQYTPTTEQVHKRPVIITPPWINKYYILDLRPDNSVVKHLVDQGHTVFMTSWRNPTPELADKTFDDYMLEGPLSAMDVAEEITGESEFNMVGYCLGGTLLASTLAYCAEKGDKRPQSATFFVTLLDFESPGDLELFIDEEQLEVLEKQMNERGVLKGSQMATAMNMLRDNDLIWSFFVNNYLHGEDPFPFDLLYWNQDSTNMPARMHSFYLRNMYLKNKLREPGGISLNGVPIDLSKVEVPAYYISTKEDHIAPWRATYEGAKLLSSNVKFTLGMSGHIAGVVNPPSKNKYGYWTNTRTGKLPADPDDWWEKAAFREGSWWPDWHKWLGQKGGAKVDARTPGSKKHPPIEDAPGSYVRERHD
ncbi:class I poly(R)-hydroxyalkanoic acid synthase [Aquisalimonas sp. 2447]|uniref:PHA/PHB synthase family protein n=1 Tax=Aquisalimonas sp. 2447 TaxID=2740807 RepID=UPI0014325BF8|nr:class I poly(R)-hydroxyalkanoic acid synthase [Aquisalimonas sp. 2447]QIT54766.1 class I poly(R)-hydroxyalkanoic acid synthase [Aquisalimonas sp. 2447]